MSLELLPCPMCNGTASVVYPFKTLDGRHNFPRCFVECDACGMKTASSENERAVIPKWNSRFMPANHKFPLAEICQDADGFKHIEPAVEDLDDFAAGTKLYVAPTQGADARPVAMTSAQRIAVDFYSLNPHCAQSDFEQRLVEANAPRVDAAIDAAMESQRSGNGESS